MPRKFNDLVQQTMSPEAQERAQQKAQQMLREMALDELRTALSLTQEHLAEALGIRQASVSKIVHGQNMYVSTLDKVIKAMGGDLELYVALPTGKIRLSLEQFRKVVGRGDSKKRSRRAHPPTTARA